MGATLPYIALETDRHGRVGIKGDGPERRIADRGPPHHSGILYTTVPGCEPRAIDLSRDIMIYRVVLVAVGDSPAQAWLGGYTGVVFSAANDRVAAKAARTGPDLRAEKMAALCDAGPVFGRSPLLMYPHP